MCLIQSPKNLASLSAKGLTKIQLQAIIDNMYTKDKGTITPKTVSKKAAEITKIESDANKSMRNTTINFQSMTGVKLPVAFPEVTNNQIEAMFTRESTKKHSKISQQQQNFLATQNLQIPSSNSPEKRSRGFTGSATSQRNSSHAVTRSEKPDKNQTRGNQGKSV